jgi:hypothetical protein
MAPHTVFGRERGTSLERLVVGPVRSVHGERL